MFAFVLIVMLSGSPATVTAEFTTLRDCTLYHGIITKELRKAGVTYTEPNEGCVAR